MDQFYVATQEYVNEIHEKDAIGRVRMNISVDEEEVSAVSGAVKTYFAGLQQSPVEPEEACEVDDVFYAGGWAYVVKWHEGNVPGIILESAGEDAISSIEIASENLIEAVLPTCPDARFSYEELPVRRTK